MQTKGLNYSSIQDKGSIVIRGNLPSRQSLGSESGQLLCEEREVTQGKNIYKLVGQHKCLVWFVNCWKLERLKTIDKKVWKKGLCIDLWKWTKYKDLCTKCMSPLYQMQKYKDLCTKCKANLATVAIEYPVFSHRNQYWASDITLSLEKMKQPLGSNLIFLGLPFLHAGPQPAPVSKRLQLLFLIIWSQWISALQVVATHCAEIGTTR